jgi:hypothetical protein
MKKISGTKPSKPVLPQCHIRMQINDRVFDERGNSDEVLAHFRAWLDREIANSISVVLAGSAVERKASK